MDDDLKPTDNETRGERWLRHPRWTNVEGLVHGTLIRAGCDAQGPVDLAEMAAGMRAALDDLVGHRESSALTLIGMHQVHGDRVATIRRPSDLNGARRLEVPGRGDPRLFQWPETDALISTRPDDILIVKTADCLPILMCDRGAKIAAVCHGGWRGLAARLPSKTARGMIALGADAERIEAWIGPGICADHYEVGGELVERFRDQFPGADVSPDGARLDLVRVAIDDLQSAGIERDRIVASGLCTFDDARRLHSWRRDGADAGRLLTLIGWLGP